MSNSVKVSGTWRSVSMPHVKIDSTWKTVKAIYNKVNGDWKDTWIQGGINDITFAKYDTANKSWSTTLSNRIQPDGKIIISGSFLSWNGVPASNIVRLNQDETIDYNFINNIGTGASNYAGIIELQADGKILLSGSISSWNGTSITGGLLRLNSDGTLDTDFRTNVGTGANSGVPTALAIQADGKIIVGGNFTSWNGTAVGRLVRLNQDGTRDTTFTTNIGTGASATVSAATIQADQKILIGGSFTSFNGVSRGYVIRLLSDGNIDTTFTTNNGTGANAAVLDIAIQSDQSVVLGGNFTSWNGTAASRIVCLNSDGTTNTTFTTNMGSGPDNSVTIIKITNDNKIIIGGNFTTWNGLTALKIVKLSSSGVIDTVFSTNIGTGPSSNITNKNISIYSNNKILVGGNINPWNGTSAGYIVRLNQDGTLDTTSILSQNLQGANASIGDLVIQPDQKIIIGGIFTKIGATAMGYVARLNQDGTIDTTFASNIGTGANNYISSIVLQPDGKIILGSPMTSWNGTAVGKIVRLNSSGTLDTTFSTNVGTGPSGGSTQIRRVLLQPDGKIIVGGLWASWNGTASNYITRLNSDGTLDTAFNTNIGTGPNNTIYGIAIQSDGKIIVGGFFTTWAGATVGRVVRLNSDGTLDTTFNGNVGTAANSYVSLIVTQPDNKILIGGAFTSWNATSVGYLVRLNSDGSLDNEFQTNNGTGGNSSVSGIKIQSDNKILIGGAFTIWNGTSANKLARLNQNGTLDTAFCSNVGDGAGSKLGTTSIGAIGEQSDKKIIVAGYFNGFNRVNRSYIARLGGDTAL